jgi:hypothetical protein
MGDPANTPGICVDTAAERARVVGYGQATVLCCCMTRYNLALGAAAAQNYWRKNYP